MNQLLNILRKDFPVLDSTKNKLLLILFLSFFTMIFLSVYNPFNMREWGGNILGYVMIGTVILLVSQFILRPVFGMRKFKRYSLALWSFTELTVMSFVIYWAYGPELITVTEEINEFILTLRYSFLLTFGPYVGFLWYLDHTQKLSSFKELAKNKTIGASTKASNELLIINGDNDKVVLAIKYHQLLYIKSAGNYLELFYLKGEKLIKELVRARIKEMEEKIMDTSVIRTHRSYMVNVQQISSLKKTKKGYTINMQHIPNEPIPVSAGYKIIFEEILQQLKVH